MSEGRRCELCGIILRVDTQQLLAGRERMKLFELRPAECALGDDPWEPWYDKAFGFVVRAETEDQARELAHQEAGDENKGKFGGRKIAETTSPWLDPKYSVCKELTADGEPGVVIQDFSLA